MWHEGSLNKGLNTQWPLDITFEPLPGAHSPQWALHRNNHSIDPLKAIGQMVHQSAALVTKPQNTVPTNLSSEHAHSHLELKSAGMDCFRNNLTAQNMMLLFLHFISLCSSADTCSEFPVSSHSPIREEAT